MHSIAQKIVTLGRAPVGPASVQMVNELEQSLGVCFPEEFRAFLHQHDGSGDYSDEGFWRFWPCSEITNYSDFREQGFFVPDHNDIRKVLPTASNLTFLGSRMIVFADALIDAPSYGMYLDDGHPCDQWIFDVSYGSLSALSFKEWSDTFVTTDDVHIIYGEE